jgi:hypothetical protein
MSIRKALACGLLAAVSSCSFMTESCTLIGCESGLTVHLQGAPQGPWSITVSSQGTTFGKDCAAGGNCGGMMFFENFLHDLVTVTVERNGSSVTYQNLAPTKTTVQPNGPRCAPTCNQHSLTVSPP